ncbi:MULTISPECIES: hypothetical protein [Cryobacterium]|uniref:Uncharacterized protein n=1 Tax=Cryobacterium levicorallinum TaxID=995038 RepID=A0ABY1EBL5_9MICO|nr:MULTISPECIES: hypothetical protein [Cryobacterium]SFH37701.1 hypothetical protein SAMN05216274_10473 [Cryobacterium levicorallinum]
MPAAELGPAHNLLERHARETALDHRAELVGRLLHGLQQAGLLLGKDAAGSAQP